MATKKKIEKYADWIQKLIFEPSEMLKVGILCLFAETLINVAIVEKVRYTEIDWKAYMSQSEGFLNGTYDYTKLRGGTGPLVYPAGFLYFFSGLYYLTGYGTNIKAAQYIFGFFYLVLYCLVLLIMKKTQLVPPFILLFFTFASYRIHSIFALRLFNDPIAMIFLYVSVYLFAEKKWSLGCIVFSLAVSIKMNIMLFAPGLFFILLVETGIFDTFYYIGTCGCVQFILGLPFLMKNPVGYLHMSFDLGRRFFYKWTVNYRFLPENLFLSRYFHVSLLAIHIGLLLALYLLRWKKMPTPLSSKSIVLILFSSNFVGVVCARSLHYQFYVWYYHTLPALFFSTKLAQPLVMLILGVIEICWNTYPSTDVSSAVLQICHVVGTAALLLPPRVAKDKNM